MKIAVTLSPSAEIYMYMHDILLYTYTHVYMINVHDNVMYTYMYLYTLHAKCMDIMHACIHVCNNSRQSKGKHSSKHLISEKRATFSIYMCVHVHTLCLMHVCTCSTQVCVHNTSRTQCVCSSMKSVCKCMYM